MPYFTFDSPCSCWFGIPHYNYIRVFGDIALFTYLLNFINFRIKWLSVLSFVMVILIKGFVCIMQILTSFISLYMWSSLKIYIIWSPPDPISSTFSLLLMVSQLHSTRSCMSTMMPFVDTYLWIKVWSSLAWALWFCSGSQNPNRYRFSHYTLQSTLDATSVPNFYS